MYKRQFSGSKESEIEVGEGLEEPRSDVRNEVRSGENSEETEEKHGKLEKKSSKGAIEVAANVKDDVVVKDIGTTNKDYGQSEDKEVLDESLHTTTSQNEFWSSQRPTRSTVRPSRFRDEAFETQFQPRRKKKVRRVCLHPGRGEFREFSSVDGVCDLTQKPRRGVFSFW